jgi:heme/copper-type cytochrome/quinol oxidase subunit 1
MDVVIGLITLLVIAGLMMWFGFAVGDSVSEDGGGFWGMLIGLVVALILIFTI